MDKPRNFVGPTVRRLRSNLGLTQAMLAARCQRLGWEISRESLAKIESQIRWVADFELIHLARVFQVDVSELFPDRKHYKSVLKTFDNL